MAQEPLDGARVVQVQVQRVGRRAGRDGGRAERAVRAGNPSKAHKPLHGARVSQVQVQGIGC